MFFVVFVLVVQYYAKRLKQDSYFIFNVGPGSPLGKEYRVSANVEDAPTLARCLGHFTGFQ